VKNPGYSTKNGSFLQREITMRLVGPEQRLDCLPISKVTLNLNCRDEIIPILRGLQHLYANASLRRELLTLVGKDVNQNTSRKRGRRGLNYWEVAVLASVRLGCNLDYDKLQDLAENHRRLRQIMGLGDWQEEEVDFDWRRIEDNVIKLRPTTVKKINELIVRAGHALQPQAMASVRGDSFVVETNIHYPTESSLIGDGLRKVVTLAAALAALHGQAGWRQHRHVLKIVKKIVRDISREARAKRKGADRLKPGYSRLLDLAKDLLERARQLLQALALCVEVPVGAELGKGVGGGEQELLHYLQLTEQVCGTARRRVLLGETVANEEKLFSIFEPHTELIQRGKQPNPIQFGHKVLVIEDAAGFICDYQVMGKGVLDQDVVVPVMTQLQKRMGGKIERASFDRAFPTPDNQEKLAGIVRHPCIPQKGEHRGREQHEAATVEFRQGRRHHPGVESAIGALQVGNGQKRCRDRSERGYERYVGLGILGRNLHVLGKLLLAQDDATCQAAKSKRKKQAG
jgi:IS5 family transposase